MDSGVVSDGLLVDGPSSVVAWRVHSAGVRVEGDQFVEL